MSTVLITGGTGLIGKHLTQLLQQKGYQVTILARETPPDPLPDVTYAKWNIPQGSIDTKAVTTADYIIHLAGANVADGRWTDKRKQELIESRTKSSELIVNTLRNNTHQVKAVVSASATGWYGEYDGDQLSPGFDEDAAPANDFLGETCRLWEESIQPVENMGIRLVKLRTGIVLAKEGGAFTEFRKPIKFGIAAIMDGGDQVVSWVHIDDICRMYWYALQNEQVRGAYNAVAPNPVSNKTLVLEIAKQQRGKRFIPIHVPSFILKLMLGEMSVEILKSVKASAGRIKSTGFQFLYPSLEAAVKALI